MEIEPRLTLFGHNVLDHFVIWFSRIGWMEEVNQSVSMLPYLLKANLFVFSNPLPCYIL